MIQPYRFLYQMFKVFTIEIEIFNVQIEINTSTSDPEIANTELNSNISRTNLEVDHKLDSKNQKGNFDILQEIAYPY